MTIAPADEPPRRRSDVWLPVEERAARGRVARARSPRSVHGAWVPGPHRRSPLAVLEEQALTRVPDLVPIRYGRMAATPFAFFRGAAAIMAADLADVPSTDLRVQLSGDAHLLNFGGFAAPDRRLVFSLNDFDETLPGPFEWDLKRLVASFALAARSRAFDAAQIRAIVVGVARDYREAMRSFATMGSLDLWYLRLDVDAIVTRFSADAGPQEVRRFRQAMQKAESKDSLRATAKLTRVVAGQRRFLDDPPTLVRLDELVALGEAEHLVTKDGRLLHSYVTTLQGDRRVLVERFRAVDLARKVVGVGSVGTRVWVALMVGRDEDDPLLLQYKEAEASVLEPYLGASAYRNHGRRVVEGQRLMQAASDILLGWQCSRGPDGVERDYYVRQLWDKKGSADVTLMTPRAMQLYGKLCGWTLARAHARSGDPAALAAYLGPGDAFDRAMAAFADAYADQTEKDHAELCQAIAAGRVQALAGV